MTRSLKPHVPGLALSVIDGGKAPMPILTNKVFPVSSPGAAHIAAGLILAEAAGRVTSDIDVALLQNPRDGSRALGVSYPEASEEALVPIFGRLVEAAERNFAQLVAARKVELKAQRDADEKKRIVL